MTLSVKDAPMWTIHKDLEGTSKHPFYAYIEYTHADHSKTDRVITGKLEELRERFESMGLVNVGRLPDDAESVIEVWL